MNWSPHQRHFLGIDRPALVAAAEFLLRNQAAGEVADLSDTVVVVPGSRAGRRLLEILAQREEAERPMFPPQVATVGRLPELLYPAKRPLAGPLVQKAAWAAALRGLDPEKLRQIHAAPPPADDTLTWLELGATLMRQHLELAADGLDFEDVVAATERLQAVEETRRWRIFREVQQRYLELLDRLGMWDRQTARLVAIERGAEEISTDRRIVLLGAVDLDRAVRQMLDVVADRVTVMTYAPESWSDRFDRLGCLVPEAWEDRRLNVGDDQIRLAEGPADQADEVARAIAGFDAAYSADEITIGVPDESLTPQITRQLEQVGVATRFGPGKSLAQTAPATLLSAVAAYVGSQRYPDFAALVRHPDVGAMLSRRGVAAPWLAQLDVYYNEHLQQRLSERWMGEGSGLDELRAAYGHVQQWLAPLSGQRPLGEWAEPLRKLLQTVYDGRTFDRQAEWDRRALSACRKLSEAFEELDGVPEELAAKTTAGDAIRIVLSELAGSQIAAAHDPDAIEMVGWLELPLDDAPALVVAGMNEGIVPQSVVADPFLPDRLRQELGINDNRRRYARDAYALSVLLASRERLQLVVGRRDAEGSPLSPSRLLLACPPEQLPERVQRLFGHSDVEAKGPLAGAYQPQRERPNFPIPRPEKRPEPITKLRPTDFRAFLECPYRFYLTQVLRLEAATDDAEELDGGSFGLLVHHVLEQFAKREDARHSTDAELIAEVLVEELNRASEAWFGKERLPPVVVQIEQIRQRLLAFAKKQADWAKLGWRIWHVEDERRIIECPLLVDDQPVTLRGRIDRVDFREETGEYAVLDYKTSESDKTPERAHQKSGQWVDLQLPIYRHLAGALEIEGEIRLGYVNLPKDTGKIDFHLAQWTAEELAAADEVAFEIVRNIRQQQFWPPTDPPPDFADLTAAICQDRVFDRAEVEDGP